MATAQLSFSAWGGGASAAGGAPMALSSPSITLPVRPRRDPPAQSSSLRQLQSQSQRQSQSQSQSQAPTRSRRVQQEGGSVPQPSSSAPCGQSVMRGPSRPRPGGEESPRIEDSRAGLAEQGSQRMDASPASLEPSPLLASRPAAPLPSPVAPADRTDQDSYSDLLPARAPTAPGAGAGAVSTERASAEPHADLAAQANAGPSRASNGAFKSAPRSRSRQGPMPAPESGRERGDGATTSFRGPERGRRGRAATPSSEPREKESDDEDASSGLGAEKGEVGDDGYEQAEGRSRKPRLGKEQPWRPWFFGMSERGMEVFNSLGEIRAGKEVVRVLNEEEARRGVLDEGDVLGLMKGFGKVDKWQQALAVFKWSHSQERMAALGHATDSSPPPAPASVSLILRILSRCSRPGEAEELFRLLVDNGFKFDVYSYTAMITSLSHGGRHAQAVALFQKMKEEGVAPNLITYNVVMGAYGKSGGSFHRMVNLLEELRAAGFTPDSYTYNTMISTCASRGQVEQAERLYAQMQREDRCEPTRVTFNALLDVYGKAGDLEQAKRVVREMAYHGLTPNRVTYNELMSAFAQRGNWQEAEELLTTMEGHWGLQPDVYSYTTLLSAYGRAGELSRVKPLLARMAASRCAMNVFTYNTLADIYGRSGELEDMEGVVADMVKAGCAPDVVTWNTLIRSYGQAQDEKGVAWAVQRMAEAGLRPNVRTYNTLIDAFTSCSSADSALAVYRSMREAGHVPNTVTFTSLLGPLAKEGRWEEAEGIAEAVRSLKGVSLDATANAHLMSAYANAGETERLRALVRRLAATGQLGGARSRDAGLERAAISALCRAGLPEEAEDLACTGSNSRSSPPEHHQGPWGAPESPRGALQRGPRSRGVGATVPAVYSDSPRKGPTNSAAHSSAARAPTTRNGAAGGPRGAPQSGPRVGDVPASRTSGPRGGRTGGKEQSALPWGGGGSVGDLEGRRLSADVLTPEVLTELLSTYGRQRRIKDVERVFQMARMEARTGHDRTATGASAGSSHSYSHSADHSPTYSDVNGVYNHSTGTSYSDRASGASGNSSSRSSGDSNGAGVSTSDSFRSGRSARNGLLSCMAFNVLIATRGAAGRPDEAEAAVLEMRALGIPPDSATYSALILAHCQVGDVDSASEWLEEAEGAGVPPDSNAVFALAKLCFQFRRFSKAGLLLRGAVEQGRSLPDAMMAVYVDSLCYMGHFKEALGVAALPESKDLAAKLQERVNSKLKEARDQLLFE